MVTVGGGEDWWGVECRVAGRRRVVLDLGEGLGTHGTGVGEDGRVRAELL